MVVNALNRGGLIADIVFAIQATQDLSVNKEILVILTIRVKTTVLVTIIVTQEITHVTVQMAGQVTLVKLNYPVLIKNAFMVIVWLITLYVANVILGILERTVM